MALFLFTFLGCISISLSDMPLPWTRILELTTPPMTGSDVLIATTLMSRCSCWPSSILPSNTYTSDIKSAVIQFQSSMNTSPDGIFGANTADITLMKFSYDKYIDNNMKASDYGLKYKLYIPVYNDSMRNIELNGSLFDANNNLMYSFNTRTHGQSNPINNNWPNYDNTPGLNEFTSNGNTPTGLGYITMNTPEPKSDEKYYGPYPIHRVLTGLKKDNNGNNMDTNLGLLVPNIRNGILLHTGEWPNWQDGDQMPDSNGCIHTYPDELQIINDICVNKLGVTIEKNEGGNGDYTPQGIISVQQL